MLNETAHADRVYSIARQNSAAASSPIVASWRRCMTMHNLAPEEPRDPLRLSGNELEEARRRSTALVCEAQDELDRLFLTVGKAGCCLVLSDEAGAILEQRSSAGDERDFHRLGLGQGAVWSEASVGTNGIGTALADERSVMIYRDQHFLSSNVRLSCATAPVRDHRGQIAAAIDISTCRDDVSEMTLSILAQAVRDAATRIEANLFRRAFAGSRFVLVPMATGSSAAILAVDRDDLILGATRAARLALKLDDARIAQGVPASDVLAETRGETGDDLLEAERAALRRVLSRTNGNVSQAAVLLGISRATLHRKLKRLSLH
ncbi:GAF domain-containing protein [Rhizobiaceae bacterium BDR2-2]|uniref:GAF domain-containing protein n=1 Tax=Ectorhizobium quercum TaxID=2965071 RepID=A0AAE3MY30_9HYPH|nr:helix-turn-helix domain-containing protein [Ectorhizobium quercum]MCX8996576.1 GAF domain-containing protein [Ectorhizobium quercum]